MTRIVEIFHRINATEYTVTGKLSCGHVVPINFASEKNVRPGDPYPCGHCAPPAKVATPDPNAGKLVWHNCETVPPPKNGRAVLVCSATDGNGKPCEPEAIRSVACQVASWWTRENDGAGAWVVYCSMVQDPELHFEPTHWAEIPVPFEGTRELSTCVVCNGEGGFVPVPKLDGEKWNTTEDRWAPCKQCQGRGLL